MNKCHTHGYITIQGLDNDILVRGNRNLNQSLNLDEVIVELLPIDQWRPLINKKTRKKSQLNDDKDFLSQHQHMPLPEYTDTDIDDTNKKLLTDTDIDVDSNSIYKENFTSKDERLKYNN